MKKQTSRNVSTTIVAIDLPFNINSNGKVEFALDTIQLPVYEGPLFDDHLYEWSRAMEIPEGVFGDAYHAAQTALFDAINKGLVMETLKKAMKYAQPDTGFEPDSNY